jgi:hypothetical protein
MTVRLLTMLMLVICCSCSSEEVAVPQPEEQSPQPIEEIITIPMEQVWSTNQNRMWSVDEPVGTRYIGELVEGSARNTSLLEEINESLDVETPGRKAESAFAVEGQDLEALKNAHAVLVKNQPRPKSLSAGKPISIVFFVLDSPHYTSLTYTKKRGNTIQIRYEFIPHLETIESSLFTLIPLGKLSQGHYQVKIDHEPYEKRYAKFGKSGPHEHVLGRVSTSFEFDVD